MMGTMSMYYVTDPDSVVANIQSLLDEDKKKTSWVSKENTLLNNTAPTISVIKNSERKTEDTRRHTVDTRERVRDVLR
jgi:hypothetical protein